LWLVGRRPADERLARRNTVDAVKLLNGTLHELILAETVERGDDIKLARDQVGLYEVRECLELLQYAPELALDLDESIGERRLVRLFPVLGVGDALDRERGLGGCDSADAPDFLDSVQGFRRLVGLQPDHQIESSGDGSYGPHVSGSLELGDDASEIALSVCEDKAG